MSVYFLVQFSFNSTGFSSLGEARLRPELTRDILKEASLEANEIWRAAGKPRQCPISDKR